MGAGAVGTVSALKFAQEAMLEKLVIADAVSARASLLADRLNDPWVSALVLDAGEEPIDLASDEVATAQERSTRQRLNLLLSGSRPEQIEAARGQLAQAESALAMARSRLKEMIILSPLDGVVLHKNLEVGEMATPGVSILTLMNPRELWVRAFVPEEEIGRIKIGDPARVKVDAYPGRTFPGRIIEIASEAEFTPKNVQTKKERVNLVFRIKIAVDNPEGILKPGMPADADIG